MYPEVVEMTPGKGVVGRFHAPEAAARKRGYCQPGRLRGAGECGDDENGGE